MRIPDRPTLTKETNIRKNPLRKRVLVSSGDDERLENFFRESGSSSPPFLQWRIIPMPCPFTLVRRNRGPICLRTLHV